MIKLFVGGFPPHFEEIELAQLMATYGDVATVKFVRDRKTKKCKGYAFVEMANLESAENAIEQLNGREMGKRTLELNIVPEKESVAVKKVAPTYQKVERPNDVTKRKRTRTSSQGTV